VALQREDRVVAVHPFAIVRDAYQIGAAVFELHADARRPGVDRVLDELFDDARRTFDHLAGRDLVRKIVGKSEDSAHL
jgi:hypothetical protein